MFRPSRNHLTLSTALLLIVCFDSTSTKSVKGNARPVHEIITEQSRSDVDKPRYVNGPAIVEYGNPLAGNSKLVAAQKARIHTQNQQAMFLAERNRQQRAQLLRYQTAPQPDTYMKAYQDSQEKHHIDLEKQQGLHVRSPPKPSNAKQDTKPFMPVKSQPLRPMNSESRQASRLESRHLGSQRMKTPMKFSTPDVIKITKDDAVRSNQEKMRNHRSQGSMYILKLDTTQRYASPERTHSVFVSATPSYGEYGVTIKPHSNIGLAISGEAQPTPDASQLFTEAIPSKTQNIYPKQYLQMQGYKSAHELTALNSLLAKTPHDQLSGLNALLHPSSHINEESARSPLQQPIDLYFYTKDMPHASSSQEYDQQNMYTYGAAYGHHNIQPVAHKDHTPIMEHVEDIADPNKHTKLKTYGIQTVLATEEPKEPTTTTNNYYKVEVASQTVSGHPKVKDPEIAQYGLQYVTNQYAEQNDLAEQYLQHTKALQANGAGEAYTAGVHHLAEEGERYLHHNAKGIHPLNTEGGSEDNLHYAANYEFGYRVRDHHTGNDFGHRESKNGDQTKGQYHVLLPDGRLQNVKYWAGPEGYHAHVSYDHA